VRAGVQVKMEVLMTVAVQRRPWGLSFALLRDAGILLGLLVILVIFSLLSPYFLTEQNLINVLQQSSINGCIAVGMTLVIISGGIDLSVGSTAALSAVVGASLMVSGLPVPLAIVAAAAVGMAAGLVNGAMVAYAGLQPFIVTLGTLSIFRALALIITDGNPVFGLPNSFRSLFAAKLWILPIPVLLVVVVGLAAWFILRRTPLGEYFLATGGNEEAARVAGVPLAMTKIASYVISGGLAALGAMVLMGWLGAADPTLGNLWELQAIAAAAIGGASLSGGRGSIIGTILGAIILGTVTDGLTLLNVQAFYQLLATGVIIIMAMMLDRATRGKTG
jgi:ribose transport system permease protein